MPNPTKQLDVYRDWLGVTETARPLNHYQLLRLKQFEDDAAKIRENYRKLNAHVRKYSAGEYGTQSQALLNELAKAMLCLTDSRRKGEYDATLGRKDKASGARQTLEEMLISRKVVDSAQLQKARNYANTVGVEIRDALVQQKLTKPEVVTPMYAESIGIPYVDLADLTLDEPLLRKIPAVLARQHSCAPVMVDDGQVLMASPHLIQPDVEEELRLRLGMPVRTVLCTPGGINDLIGKHYPREAAAAEMAGKSAVPQSARAATGQDTGPRLSPEEAKKRQRMISLVTFNFAFMGTVMAQVMFRHGASMMSMLGIGLVVGLIAGGSAFILTGKRR
jgi:hypothetical protein